MGSGCVNTNSSKIKGCLQITSSNCVSWQGDISTPLDVCVGDTITEVINSIITQLTSITDGTDVIITLENLCDSINTELVGKEKTLTNVLQALADVLCSVVADVETIQTELQPETYSVVCLTGGSSSLVSRQTAIQLLISNVCSLIEQVNTLNNTIIDSNITSTINTAVGNFLKNAISSCGNNGLVKSGVGDTTTLKFTGMVPLYCPVPYIGPVGYFDTTGKGLEAYGMCGWYIMNGNNGTQNWMGYTFAGATAIPGISGTALDSIVSFPDDAANIGDKKGIPTHSLSINEMPSHIHKITDPGHTHSITGDVIQKPSGSGTFNVTLDNYTDANPSPYTSTYDNKIASSTIGIEYTDSTGQNIAHENRQPTVYGIWIVRLP